MLPQDHLKVNCRRTPRSSRGDPSTPSDSRVSTGGPMSAHVLKKSALLEERSKGTEAAQQGREEGQTFSGVLTANSSFLAWLVSLGFGGALLVLYYTHIHYFPDLEWKESLTYLAALSLLGGTVAFLYSLLLFFPGLIWSEFLIHDSEMEDKLCYPDTDHV